MPYTGRFAPSPTGELHFGSLLAALASYLDARAHQGRWLLRIEDLDPPREQPGVKQRFPAIMETFGLHWDGEVTFQSQRLNIFRQVLDQLIDQGDAYPCGCSRKQLQLRSGSAIYDRFCTQPDNRQQDKPQAPAAVRADCGPLSHISRFDDLIQGPQALAMREIGDFVIFRKDGLFAYQLAVVVDDYLQGISHVVRGSDLLDETHRQLRLQHLLGYPHPAYAHIPVASNSAGQKLSKQTYAHALDCSSPIPQLIDALDFLGQQPIRELTDGTVEEVIDWARQHWQRDKIPALKHQLWKG
ncbi:tRNA glutamyl-Q(34) synthetase GluQRS [Marinobacterium jannaschii]|uniref:tRNA glutamyl-Q(34) synthetase GluQRS n=1 Tax=Marinobacterium jannaschii TaxID=64970 RepID=UPI0004890D1C|nr:tRNA glutamyl-Q(34) synthetase GluQRS [Marinobacterium jannaschii]